MAPKEGGGGPAGGDGMLPAETVAKEVTDAMDEQRFMVMPHKAVAKYFQNKAKDYDRWIKGMGKLQDGFGKLVVKMPNMSAAKL